MGSDWGKAKIINLYYITEAGVMKGVYTQLQLFNHQERVNVVLEVAFQPY